MYCSLSLPLRKRQPLSVGVAGAVLALLVGDKQGWLTTEGFLDAIGDNLDRVMAKA